MSAGNPAAARTATRSSLWRTAAWAARGPARACRNWRERNIIMNLSEFDISKQYTAMLLSSDRITAPESDAEVRHLVLQLPKRRFEYREGQSVGVLAPGPHEFGNR